MRASGKVPAVMYGEGVEAMPLALDARELQHALSTGAGVNALLDVTVDGETHLAMARELSRDPIRGSIIHVDLLRIDRTKPIEVDVPVHLEGEPVGVKEGGVLEHVTWQVHLSCLPDAVPDRIDAAVSHLGIGDSLQVSELTVPPGVTILTAPEETIATVVVPQVLQVEEEVAEELLEGEEADAAGEAAEGEAAEGAAEGGAESGSEDER